MWIAALVIVLALDLVVGAWLGRRLARRTLPPLARASG